MTYKVMFILALAWDEPKSGDIGLSHNEFLPKQSRASNQADKYRRRGSIFVHNYIRYMYVHIFPFEASETPALSSDTLKTP